MQPIIIYRPKFHLVPLDGAGVPVEGGLVDVSCDMAAVELPLDTPTTDVTTFCGTFQIPGDIVEGCVASVTVNADTHTRWASLVGAQMEARVYDRQGDVDYRRFDTQVPADPSLYGKSTPGEARTIDLNLPVLSSPEWVIAS